MLIDANILLFAVDELSPFRARATAWLEQQLSGSQRVAFPWQSLTAFVRVATSPRVFARPLDPVRAWEYVEEWLLLQNVWIPVPDARHAEILGSLVRRYRPTGKLVPDTELAALAVAYGLSIASADTDFARFTEIEWVNPLAA